MCKIKVHQLDGGGAKSVASWIKRRARVLSYNKWKAFHKGKTSILLEAFFSTRLWSNLEWRLVK